MKSNESTHPKLQYCIYAAEALLVLAMIGVASMVALHMMRSFVEEFGHAQPYIVSDLIEAESLVWQTVPATYQGVVQPTTRFKRGKWSGHRQLFLQFKQEGDRIAFVLPREKSGQVRIIAHLTKSYDYGIFRVRLNGAEISELDLYNSRVAPSGSIDLGTHLLNSTKNQIEFEATGHNPKTKAPYYQFGIDGFVIESL